MKYSKSFQKKLKLAKIESQAAKEGGTDFSALQKNIDKLFQGENAAIWKKAYDEMHAKVMDAIAKNPDGLAKWQRSVDDETKLSEKDKQEMKTAEWVAQEYVFLHFAEKFEACFQHADGTKLLKNAIAYYMKKNIR